MILLQCYLLTLLDTTKLSETKTRSKRKYEIHDVQVDQYKNTVIFHHTLLRRE